MGRREGRREGGKGLPLKVIEFWLVALELAVETVLACPLPPSVRIHLCGLGGREGGREGRGERVRGLE